MKKVPALVVLFSLFSGVSFASSASCVELSNNLARGSKDADTNGEVTLLQQFLYTTKSRDGSSYLSTQPTGFFWYQTVGAVKKFQEENGIKPIAPMTRVGPQTRDKIKELTCGGEMAVASSKALTTESNLAVASVSTPQTSQTSVINIISPWSGQSLTNANCAGESCFGTPAITTIRWSGGQSDVTIDLYNESNLRVKTIAQTANSGSYRWLYDPSLSDGRYKIRITSGGMSTDTGLFTIGEGQGIATPVDPITPTTPATTPSNADKQYDLYSNLNTRVIVDLSGSQIGAVSFGSWRDYSSTGVNVIHKSGTVVLSGPVPNYTTPTRLEVNISTVVGSFSPIHTNCRQVSDGGPAAATIEWTADPSITPASYVCVLQPNTKYYANVRFIKADGTTACTGSVCGEYLDLTYRTLTVGNINPSTPITATNCPAVPSKTRTYSRDQRASWWDEQRANTTGVSTLTLLHYRYPETVEVGTHTYFGERCALSATPGSRTCPYPNSIYASGEDVNTYSIFTRAPDQTNDSSESGDRFFTAYKKPIIGFSRSNRAFDISIPFVIKSTEVGKKFDFYYMLQNQKIANEGQYSISECEGDFSERSVLVGNYGQGAYPRANVLATNGLEGSKFTPGYGVPWMALKVNKVYYLNLRWVKTKQASGFAGSLCVPDVNNNCLSPFIPTDQIPDTSIHDSALGRQIRSGANDDALEFYRWDFSQYNDAYFGVNITTEAQLQADPLFDQPGGVVLSPGLYYPTCGALGTIGNGILGSDCQAKCMTGYVANGRQCVKQ